MKEAGLPPAVIEAGYGEENGHDAMQRVLDARQADAVFAFHDYSAIGAMNAALARRVRVPEDIAVVGFCDTDCARHVTVPLTTVVQPTDRMGKELATLAMQRLAKTALRTPRVILPTRLVVRHSCGASCRTP